MLRLGQIGLGSLTLPALLRAQQALASLEPEEPPLNDIGSIERNGTKSDFGLPLGEAESARAGQDFNVDIGVCVREIHQDRRQDIGAEPVR